jgi:hypothetical protein
LWTTAERAAYLRQAGAVEQLRVDPAALRSAAAEVTRLGAGVRASRQGAAGQVGALASRLGALSSPVAEQWRAAGGALDRLEADFREVGRALSELADYFAELDRQAVGR